MCATVDCPVRYVHVCGAFWIWWFGKRSESQLTSWMLSAINQATALTGDFTSCACSVPKYLLQVNQALNTAPWQWECGLSSYRLRHASHGLACFTECTGRLLDSCRAHT